MKTATFATLFAYAATTLASQQSLQLSASSPSSGTASPLQFVEIAAAGKRVLAASPSNGLPAPITLDHGLLKSDTIQGAWTASLDGGLVTFTESEALRIPGQPGNVTVNSQGVVAQNGHAQDWHLCQMGETQALSYGKHDNLNCQEITLFAEPEGTITDTITIKTVPTGPPTLIIFGHEYPAPMYEKVHDRTLLWIGFFKAMAMLVGTMGLGAIVAYRGLQEKALGKKEFKSVKFAE